MHQREMSSTPRDGLPQLSSCCIRLADAGRPPKPHASLEGHTFQERFLKPCNDTAVKHPMCIALNKALRLYMQHSDAISQLVTPWPPTFLQSVGTTKRQRARHYLSSLTGLHQPTPLTDISAHPIYPPQTLTGRKAKGERHWNHESSLIHVVRDERKASFKPTRQAYTNYLLTLNFTRKSRQIRHSSCMAFLITLKWLSNSSAVLLCGGKNSSKRLSSFALPSKATRSSMPSLLRKSLKNSVTNCRITPLATMRSFINASRTRSG